MPHGYVAEVDLLDLDAWELERLVRARQILARASAMHTSSRTVVQGSMLKVAGLAIPGPTPARDTGGARQSGVARLAWVVGRSSRRVRVALQRHSVGKKITEQGMNHSAPLAPECPPFRCTGAGRPSGKASQWIGTTTHPRGPQKWIRSRERGSSTRCRFLRPLATTSRQFAAATGRCTGSLPILGSPSSRLYGTSATP